VYWFRFAQVTNDPGSREGRAVRALEKLCDCRSPESDQPSFCGPHEDALRKRLLTLPPSRFSTRGGGGRGREVCSRTNLLCTAGRHALIRRPFKTADLMSLPRRFRQRPSLDCRARGLRRRTGFLGSKPRFCMVVGQHLSRTFATSGADPADRAASVAASSAALSAPAGSPRAPHAARRFESAPAASRHWELPGVRGSIRSRGMHNGD